jgi:AraC-like DNA-binding protein
VRDSLLDASYIYPTHGDQIIDLAVNILDGKPYNKETLLMSALVTRDNAKVLLMENEEIMRQYARLDLLHRKANTYLRELDTQRVVNWLAFGFIVLLMVVFVLFYLYHLRKISMQRERVATALWNMGDTELAEKSADTEKQTSCNRPQEEAQQAEKTVSDSQQPSVGKEQPVVSVSSAFVARFREVVEARLSDSNLSIDDLAADMALSRVQLYRKVKSVTGSSPIELLRIARLKRAYQLLLTSDKSVSEVAYAVGFTAPSYFTKCFKEEYGMVPGDVRKG